MALVAPQYRSSEVSEFIQDNWRLNRWLTLNLGLRYDVFTPFTEKHNAISNFDPTDAATLASGRIQVAGVNGVNNTVNMATCSLEPALPPRSAAARCFAAASGPVTGLTMWLLRLT